MQESDLEAARAVGFHYVGYAARSRSELERRLERSEFAPEVIATIVSEFVERGWIDDEAFAKQWVEDRADRKRYGKSRLAAELRRKGIEKETVQEAVGGVEDEAELRRALEAARSKWRAESLESGDRDAILAEKRRIANFLQRRGFSWNIITQVFARLMPNQE